MGSVYKIIVKLLASRLKVVVPKLISTSQTAFVCKRHRVDGVLILNELVDFSKRSKRRCMLVKIDFENTYDCVSWDFLRSMLRRMEFGDKWYGWLEALVFSSSMSILANGIPTVDFKVSRGLRQWDPLSPFLFLLVAEGFAGLLHQAVALGFFKGFTLMMICILNCFNLQMIQS